MKVCHFVENRTPPRRFSGARAWGWRAPPFAQSRYSRDADQTDGKMKRKTREKHGLGSATGHETEQFIRISVVRCWISLMAFTGASLSESLEKFAAAAGCFLCLQSSYSSFSLGFFELFSNSKAALSADSPHVIHLHFRVYFGLFVVREYYSCLHMPALMIIFSSWNS